NNDPNNGYSITGWKQINDKWYYFDNNGAMVTGSWQQKDNKWYYLGKNGVMYSNVSGIKAIYNRQAIELTFSLDGTLVAIWFLKIWPINIPDDATYIHVYE
ncbi:hypothetical protein IKG_05935, partial [Bacillus cereus VD200]